jgi:hypothetical protein
MDTIYDTNSLLGVIDLVHKPKRFLSQVFFPEESTHATAAISIDVKQGGQRLAPFVSPCVEGRPVRRDGFETRTFMPAYIKPKMPLTPCDVMTRRPGEAFMGSMSASDRMALQISDDLRSMMDRIENRIEWMAAKTLTFGFVDVVGDGYPLTRVDFLRPATNQTILAGANLWSATTSVPIQNIESWATAVSLAQGGTVTDIVLGSNVFAQLSKHADFKAFYNFQQPLGGPLPNILPSVMDDDGKIYRGYLGSFRLWSYNATYLDELTGLSTFYIPANDVILIARQSLEGRRAFGAIQDSQSLQAVPFFPKQWENNDPSIVFTMVQSAPLTIPGNVNSVFRATVL